MFSIYIRGERDYRDADIVRLTLIIYRTSHVRVTKLLCITGLYADWNKKSRCFEPNSPDNISKNKLLQQERIKYLKIAERWECSGRNWTSVELSHHFDNDIIHPNRSRTVSQIFDNLIEEYADRKRICNGKLFTGKGTAKNIRLVKKSVERFTLAKYHREFSYYRFSEIDQRFLLDHTFHEQQRGMQNGNRGNLFKKLKCLYSVCIRASAQKIYGVNLSVFDTVWQYIRPQRPFSKAASHETILKIERMDRTGLLKREELYLDMFLFSYYAGGMTCIDTCYIEHSWIKHGIIEYQRIKFPNRVKVVLANKAAAIIEKYRKEGYMDYVFPVFKKRDMSVASRMRRVEWINQSVNGTLKKVCEQLGITQKITWGTARSSFISRLVDAGYTPLQICEQTGNSPAAIYKYYYAVTDHEKMRSKMNEIF
ncbi:phage integrase SAM-like domain-containing protein [Porphyromonas macacae]|uniref:phage integrase SAM-like domain-containing protein n=1 Tax=Porphyromonas macacae TaxID=28115 RepID=UPI0024ACA121|nr:phage integrase SAM-like domain-containing protein [Porphyromonas macacae]